MTRFRPVLLALLLAAPPGVAGADGIEDLSYPSKLLGQDVPVKVYTPPGYASGKDRLPVVYNLHGGGGSPDRQWDRVKGTLTAAMDGGKVRPVIYVFANGLGNTEFVNTADGKPVERSIVEELIPFVDGRYRTVAEKRGRAVDGFSMGGWGCLSVAFRNPDTFGSVVSYGAALTITPKGKNYKNAEHFAEHDPHALAKAKADAIRTGVRVRVVCGEDDGLHPSNVKFKDLLGGLKIPVDWVPVPGVGHDTKGLYDRVGLDSLKFLAAEFDKADGKLTGPGPALATKGHAFLLDGKPFALWGVRAASASQTQGLTDHLIAQLDDYKAHGVNAVTVFYMGGSAGYGDPFTPDGKAIDPAHQARMEAIVRACARRGMVAVVGVFYQRCERPSLKDWDAARQAVRTVARALKPHRNVILNVANEQNSPRYKKLPWGKVNDPAAVLELCRDAKAEDPDRLVGGGGYDHANNEVIGKSKDVDVLLFDTDGDTRSGPLYERFVRAGVAGKPVVNVETFGGWTNKFLPQGVFPDEVRRKYLDEVADAAKHPGLSVFLHNTPWFQAFSPGERSRYDLGGRGTKDDPGVRWYFEAVKKARAAPPPR